MTTKLLPPEPNVPSRPATGAGRSKLRSVCLSAIALAVVTIPTGLWNRYDGNRHLPLTGFWRPHSEQDTAKLVRKYNLQTGVRWMNPGMSLRLAFLCRSHCPVDFFTGN